jgi:subtilisin family serine protease
MAQRPSGRATSIIASGLAAACIAVTAAGPAAADTVRDQEWWLGPLHVTKAWLSSKGTGVTVAVLDTGVDPNQPDLAGSVTTGKDYTGSGEKAGSQFWGMHGTAVASLIAGHGHGPHHADGVIGVAPAAKILSVRVTLESKDPLLANTNTVTGLPMSIARGIRYAVRRGAKVIELPMDPAALPPAPAMNTGGTGTGTGTGGTTGTDTPTTAGPATGGTTTGGSRPEKAAIAEALHKGVVLVAPAGDGGAGADTVNYPAAYPGVISVGAFGQDFVKAPYTSHLPYVTLTAAGNNVIAANGPTGYTKLRTTSAASAMVAGMAALIRAQFPTLTPAQVEKALISSTAFHHKGGRKDGSGYGTADADAALLAAARINSALSAGQGNGATPTPPKAPAVKVHTPSLWHVLRYPVLGLAAILLIALIILIIVRTRQRRALNAQLAPLRAAAQASRAHQPANGTGRLSNTGPIRMDSGPPWSGQSAGMSAAARPAAGWAPADFTGAGRPASEPAGSGGVAAASPGGVTAGGPGEVTAGGPGRVTAGGPGGAAPGSSGGAVAGSGAGRRTAGSAPFDDPEFVPPSFNQPAPGSASPRFGGPRFDSPAFGSARFSGRGFGADDTSSVGSAAADPPALGSAAADEPGFSESAFGGSAFGGSAFGDAPGEAHAGGSRPGDSGPAGGARGAGAPGGRRPAMTDPPVPPVRTLGSTHRLNTVRAPKTTGHPPWEPAEKPTGELPWMDAPARGGSGGRMIAPRRSFPGGGTTDDGPAGDADGESAGASGSEPKAFGGGSAGGFGGGSAGGFGGGSAGGFGGGPSGGFAGGPAAAFGGGSGSGFGGGSAAGGGAADGSPGNGTDQGGGLIPPDIDGGLPRRGAVDRGPFPDPHPPAPAGPPGGQPSGLARLRLGPRGSQPGPADQDEADADGPDDEPPRRYTWNPSDTTVSFPAVPKEPKEDEGHD